MKMGINREHDLIFGRTFLATTEAQINLAQGTVLLNFRPFQSSLFTKDGKRIDGPPKLYLQITRPWWEEDKGENSYSVPLPDFMAEHAARGTKHTLYTISSDTRRRREKRPAPERRLFAPRTPVFPKAPDPGALFIACQIREGTFERCLCDTGASINVMPISMARYLGFKIRREERTDINLANQSSVMSYGAVNNVLVQVGGVIVPTDFTVLGMSSDPEYDLIFGRPFLTATKALLDQALGTVTLRFGLLKSVMFTKCGREFDGLPQQVAQPLEPWRMYEMEEGSSSRGASNITEYTVNVVSSDPRPIRHMLLANSPRPDSIPRLTLPKFNDPGAIFISCRIGEVTLSKCLIDTGASVNIMPMQTARFLSSKIWKNKEGTTFIRMADQSRVESISEIEDLPLIVGGVTIPTDFSEMDMQETPGFNLLLGRPFLASTGAEINLAKGKVTLSLGGFRKRVFTRNGFEFDIDPYSGMPLIESPPSRNYGVRNQASTSATGTSSDTPSPTSK